MRKVITYGLWGLTVLSFFFGCSVVLFSDRAVSIAAAIGYLFGAFAVFIFFFTVTIAVSLFFSWLDKRK